MSNNGNSSLKRLAVTKAPMTCANDYFKGLASVLQRLSHEQIDEICEVLLRAYEEDRKIFLFGNGGSASLASHFACDLGKGTTVGIDHGKRFRAIALTDNVPMMTAWANDSNYDDIFAEQLRNLIEPGDVAFAISASGNSPNVLKALDLAGKIGAVRIGLAGYAGGKMKGCCDLCLVVPADNMQLIEDIHLSVAHALYTAIRHRLQSQVPTTGVVLASAAAR